MMSRVRGSVEKRMCWGPDTLLVCCCAGKQKALAAESAGRRVEMPHDLCAALSQLVIHMASIYAISGMFVPGQR